MVDNEITLRSSTGRVGGRAKRQAMLLSVVIGLMLLISLTASLFFKKR